MNKIKNHKHSVRALVGVDLTINRGEFVTLFGPSGCGKSTLLRVIAGLEDQTTGEAFLFMQKPRQASKRKNIAWVPQSSALLPWLTIKQNVNLSHVFNRKADYAEGSERMPEDADEVLADLGLGDFADARPVQLSGGMRQRAAIARGFVHGAPVMLMDEPFSALDDLTRETLRWRLLDIWEQHRKTVVFVTHSAFEATLLSDRVVVMTPRPGRINSIVDIDLPRPRTPEVIDSTAFVEKVREVKNTLQNSWKDDG